MLKELAAGLSTTLRVFFRPKVTIQYPKEKKQRSARFRGKHELRRYSNGMEMCVGCELCQVACPANAIIVIGGENDPENPHSVTERYAYRYEVDMLRCIFCGLCEEACPTDALHLTQDFELAGFSRDELEYSRDRLVSKEKSRFDVPEVPYHNFYEGLYGGSSVQDTGDPEKEEASS